MSNTKQTTVEWIFEELGRHWNGKSNMTYQQIKDKSKVMEKEQMKEMLVWLDDTDRRPKQIEEVFEHYYKETYGE